MNELTVFNNEQFGELRTIMIEEEPWFVAADVCKILDLSNPTVAVERLDEDERSKFNLGRQGQATIINEFGLYSLVIGSRKKEAQQFKRWITHEVLPSIRKTGMYATPATIDNILANPDMFIQLLQEYKLEQQKNNELTAQVAIQNQQLAEMRPKATYYDVVLSCPDPLSMSEIANDYGKSAKWMNKYLHEKGIQYKMKGRKIWLPYKPYADKGYTKIVTATVPDKYGMHTREHTYWTQKGRLFIYDTLKSDGILPLIEQGYVTDEDICW